MARIFLWNIVATLAVGTVGASATFGQAGPPAPAKDYAVQATPLKSIKVTDAFWAPRIEVNRSVSFWHVFKEAENVGEFDNFAKAAGKMEGAFKGSSPARDSDAYKCIEGACYSLMLHPDPKLQDYIEKLIANIVAAQEPDGYIYTARKITPADQLPAMAGRSRFVNEKDSHETYVMGLLCEAGVAYYDLTGKRTLLDVAIKAADMLDKTFGPGPDQLHATSGHEEVEMGLVKLYRATGEQRYLKLAQYFVDQRGRRTPNYGAYAQDNRPVIEQTEAVGHAVRGGYLYAGATDLAILTGNEPYSKAIDALWHNVVDRKMYITGGLGARRSGEAFGNDYELPTMAGYNETCAAVGGAFWQQRLFLQYRDAKYIDVLERTLYNQVLAGVSQSGDRFFYTNVLESDGARARSTRLPWFAWPCCLTNVVRIVPSVPSYVYATGDGGAYVNLFVASEASLKLPGVNAPVKFTQQTNYPWDGNVKMAIAPAAAADFTIRVRIPGWAQGKPVPGDLYHYAEEMETPQYKLMVNGRAVMPALEKGYAVIKRTWQPGDTVELNLAMPIRRLVANDKVEATHNRAALERGPLVYCVEGIDNGGRARALVIPPNAPLTAEFKKDLLGGVTVIQGKENSFTAVPYYAWSNRGDGEMMVWVPTQPGVAPTTMPGRGR